jgi:hypothetical protein
VKTRIGGRDHAAAELFFGHLEAGTTVPRLFRPEEIMGWLAALRIFEVAVDENGERIHRVGVPFAAPAADQPPAASRSAASGTSIQSGRLSSS